MENMKEHYEIMKDTELNAVRAMLNQNRIYYADIHYMIRHLQEALIHEEKLQEISERERNLS